MNSVIHDILDKARWAPSGDNVQSWQFEVAGERHIVIYTEDTRHDTVYDLNGHPSQLAFGCLLETLAIAASGHGLRADITRRALPPSEETRPVFDVQLVADPQVVPSPLIGVIEKRSVQRRPMSTRRLTAQDKAGLEASVAPGYEVVWLESFAERFAAARLMYRNAELRLTMPEAFEVHRRIIEWNARYSDRLVPDQALGVDAVTLKLMKWAMVSWGRMSTVNRLLGTWAPRLQMDLLPGIACAAHFVIQPKNPPPVMAIDDYVAAGRAVQRFWLTLTVRGLFMQPQMTPLIFAKYIRDDTHFTAQETVHEKARQLRLVTERLLGADAVFAGRLGAGPAPYARSRRKPLDALLKP